MADVGGGGGGGMGKKGRWVEGIKWE